ncbi:MAG TPA: type III pantothenate kinase, partial [Candidatus Tectomicrobia bacterium]|nr:type III pantothenate kinase [Candidatus Tectomicrobia bacterium]
LSRRDQTADEYGLFIETLLRTRGLDAARLTGVAIANVVPQVQSTLEQMSERYFGAPAFNVTPETAGVPLEVDFPGEVGADRIVTVAGALARHAAPLIVIDLGTATKFNCVNAAGAFIGGAIAPGIRTAADALLSRAARLFNVELVRPKEAVARNTVTNIQSGFVYGFAALVDGMVHRIRGEMGGAATVVATGGLAPLIADVTPAIEHVHEHLTLEGVRIVWERARRGGSD